MILGRALGRKARATAIGRFYLLTHAGSNTMWYCVAWVSNDPAARSPATEAGNEAAKARDEAVGHQTSRPML